MSDRKTRWRPAWTQVVVSGLIMLLGVVSARELDRVDQDLRTMYTEHTLAAADLAHIAADVIRYRTTVILASEARSADEFKRIAASLPDQRLRVQLAIERYEGVFSRESDAGARQEEHALAEVRQSLDGYFASAEQTIALLTRLWATKSPVETVALRDRVELHIRDTAGARLVAVSMALDRLLETVAEVGKDMQDDGIVTIRETSAWLLIGSVVLALVNVLTLSELRRVGLAGKAGKAAHAPGETEQPQTGVTS